jgi:DNA-binding transcriptional MerR regulator
MNDKSEQPLAVGEDSASRRLGISSSTLRSWRSQKIGVPYVRAGRRVLYLVSDLDAFLKSNRVETETR